MMIFNCFGLRSLRKRTRSSSPRGIQGVHIPTHIAQFSFNELRSATDNFSTSNKIGRGGFGIVYKGVLRTGIQIAAKRLSVESKQGLREFLTEIDTIANVRHPNLVQLVGCCVEGANRILVYEYLDNNSLDRALLSGGSFTGAKINLDWQQRSAICLGIAQGLAFLHEEAVPHIVHRDIKASNILLDKDFKPKIGDFGLAKLFPDDITHISTRIAGTTGYLAPEYVLGGQLTMKADVYSFGVLVLEIVSGRSSTRLDWEAGHRFLLELAWQLYENGELMKVIDPELLEFPEEEVVRYMMVAFFCTQAASNRRPSMGQVLEMLSKKIKINEKEISAPGFFQGSSRSVVVEEKPFSSKNPTADSSYQMSTVPSTITQVTPR